MTVTQVALFDPKRSYAKLQSELEDAALRVLKSGRYIMGAEVENFEEECVTYLKVKHAIGVSSGTDALIMALMALGIGPGDEVIVPTYTFFATAGSVARIGAIPVFVDSCPCCFNISPSGIAEKITKKTKAIIPVHLFGQAAEMATIMELAEKHGIPVIEDACQAIGAEYRGQRVGSIGKIGCFSFFPAKNLGAFGDAGLVTTNDDALAIKLKALRSHGEVVRYDHQMIGGNFRIDALQCALLNVKLKYLDESTVNRQKNAALYQELLTFGQVAKPNIHGTSCGDACAAKPLDAIQLNKSDNTKLPVLLPLAMQSRHVFNQYVIRVPHRRDALQQHLAKKNIATAIYYPAALHAQKAFSYLGHSVNNFPVAYACSQDSLALPVWPELTSAEVSYVANHIINFFKEQVI
ncbi:MAG: DegT/DnrJ/EryC1/StrS family aminotransferase [Deltaproteobacteria bacterium]|nr:DegT/DnrJ/EryC1/StrS family aminotransferase [Deltaproteobacteria bacterium]